MDITLYDLMDAYEFADLSDVFTECYGDKYTRNAAGFEQVYADLKARTETCASDFALRVGEWTGCDDKAYKSIHGIRDADEQTYAMSFTPWSEWLGMRIDPETILNYNAKEIICHCLWEMTFHGYNEKDIELKVTEMETLLDEFDKKADKIENVEALMNELEDIEDEEEAKDFLRKLLRDEIESDSSEETMEWSEETMEWSE